MGEFDLKICQNFVGIKFFLTFVGGNGVKIIWGKQYLLLHFNYFISLETANTQKSEVFLLRVSSENVNASGVVTCWYPQL